MNKEQPRVVIVDHFDSFTYNLVVAFENLGATVQVFRTNADIEDIRKTQPTHIVLSPGPGHPKDVPLFQKVIERWKGHAPILGVCLGHQAIGLYFGASVVRCGTIMHGKTCFISNSMAGIFHGLPYTFQVCRYHSLAILRDHNFCALEQLANCHDGVVMAVRARKFPHVVGVQFHPESLFTDHGSELLKNFLMLEAPLEQRGDRLGNNWPGPL